MGKLIADILVALVILTFAYGAYRLVRMMLAPTPSTEMTDRDVVLYRDAAKILNRLINLTDLSGDVSEDMVSDSTRKRIATWIDAYKKELRKR